MEAAGAREQTQGRIKEGVACVRGAQPAATFAVTPRLLIPFQPLRYRHFGKIRA